MPKIHVAFDLNSTHPTLNLDPALIGEAVQLFLNHLIYSCAEMGQEPNLFITDLHSDHDGPPTIHHSISKEVLLKALGEDKGFYHVSDPTATI